MQSWGEGAVGETPCEMPTIPDPGSIPEMMHFHHLHVFQPRFRRPLSLSLSLQMLPFPEQLDRNGFASLLRATRAGGAVTTLLLVWMVPVRCAVIPYTAIVARGIVSTPGRIVCFTGIQLIYLVRWRTKNALHCLFLLVVVADDVRSGPVVVLVAFTSARRPGYVAI